MPVNPEPAAAGVAVAWGYGRVSIGKQVKKGHSLEAQKEALEHYYRYALQKTGVAWGGLFMDRGTSAYKVPLNLRKAGGQLLLRMQPGHHLILTKLDRAFRRINDAVNTITSWIDMGITVHVLDFGCNTATPHGRLFLHMLAAVAEFEREMIAERARDAARHRQAHGGPTNQHPGYGYRLVGPAGRKRRVEDPEEMQQVQRIVELHDRQNWRFEDICHLFFRENIRTRGGKLWSYDRIVRAWRQMTKSSASAPSRSPAPARGSMVPSPAMPSPGTTASD